MRFINKYNISQEAYDKMLKDGVIGIQWPRWESIYEDFKKGMAIPGAVKSRVIMAISDKENISERHIREIISRLE
jgi:hypothetical protein